MQDHGFAPFSYNFTAKMRSNKWRGQTNIYASFEGLVDREELCWLKRFENVEAKRRTKVNTILLDGAKRRCKGLCVGGGANVLQDECQALRMLN